MTDGAAVRQVMQGHAAVMSAIPYYYNGPMAEAAVDGGCHFSDLGGNTEIVLSSRRSCTSGPRRKGVSVIPDCGLAPGMVNILAAEGIRRLDPGERVKIFVGGLPQQPEPPLNYQIVYSLEGVLDYYTTPSWVAARRQAARRWTRCRSASRWTSRRRSGRSRRSTPAAASAPCPSPTRARSTTMEYKTLRYPGHVAIMRPIRELGLLDNKPVEVKGQPVVPRDLFIAAVSPRLHKPKGKDLVALRWR